MEPRERHFGPIATVGGEGHISTDVGLLITRLILFERCILESVRFQEIPLLVRAFGTEGFMKLLDAPEFDIVCDAMTMGSIGQFEDLRRGDGLNVLPLGSYNIAPVMASGDDASRREYISGALQNVTGLAPMGKRANQHLRRSLADKALAYPNVGLAAAEDYFAVAATNGSSVTRSIQVVLQRDLGLELPLAAIDVTVHALANRDQLVESNLRDVTSLGEEEIHRVVETALLGLAGMSIRVELMKEFDAVTGFRDAEVPIFEERLSFLAAQIDPQAQEERFHRVVHLGGLPSLDGGLDDLHIDVDSLLKLRRSPECVAMRAWLRSIDGQPDQEIADMFTDLQERLAALVHGRIGRAVRFLVTKAPGLLDGGMALGGAATLGDRFLADRVIGKPGPATFLGKRYRSIFRDQ